MKLEQAKAIPIEQFLAKCGFEPTRRKTNQLWYLSPLRQEKTPSFKVNPALNAYYDFGSGSGGSIIDLAMELGGEPTIPAALRFIERSMGGIVPEISKQPASKKSITESKVEILSVGPIRSLELKRYLAKRGIDHRQCSREIDEVHYAVNGRSYVAIGFASDRDGLELRSPQFKGGLGPKAISTRDSKASSALVFEGFFDYLTYIALWGKPRNHVIVLNSVSLRDQAISYLQEKTITRIDLFRDNDAAGESLLNYFREQLPSARIIDRAAMYTTFNDLNEWHQTNLSRPSRSSV